MVVGDSESERNIIKRIVEVQKKYADQVEIVLLNKLPYTQMLERLRNTQQQSAILFFRWASDVEGQSFVPVQVLQTICLEAKVPVFGTAIQFLSNGIIGGLVENPEENGQNAGNAVSDILGGKRAFDNKGTCFSFSLPKARGKPVNIDETLEMVQEVAVSVEKVETKLRQSFKVLAVDDEATNLRVLKSLLAGDGYQVLTAASGIEAIEIIKDQQDIDLVLMDVMMPRMSGYEACRKIREDYSLYDLPLLILTVRNTPEDIAVGFEAGANDFVTKPFVAKELRARVATLLLMKKSVQEALKNEMAFLQAQIKPHFLYNALSTIMSYCYTDGARAGDLLANLSEYLQKSFNIDKTSTTVSLENELELTKAYTEIEKARFGERLTVEYDVDENLMEQRILPLTIQPLVENSIRHGLMKRKNGGRVKITIRRKMDKIGITVEDNGIGIEDLEAIFQRKDALKQKGGVGLTNIKRRLMKYYGTELYLTSNANEGTKIYFAIPDQGIW